MKNLINKANPWIKISTIFFASIILWISYPNKSDALKRLPATLQPGATEIGDNVFPPPICNDTVRIYNTIKAKGFKVRGTRIDLEATDRRYVIFQKREVGGGCTSNMGVFSGPYQWIMTERPQGSNSTLQNTNSFTPSFTPDEGGIYKINFKACPQGCQFAIFNKPPMSIGSEDFEIVINVSDEAVVPPATEPISPSQTRTDKTSFDNLCSGGFVNAQWGVVGEWNGPQDYHLLEGVVKSSRVARMDNYMNHHSQDCKFKVETDPAYTYLVNAKRSDSRIEVEWERNSFPEAYRPTTGDRVSVLGYWVRDCGHERSGRNDTEIHPPVMVATHRARPIEITGYGSNVLVPGIITDMWVNNNAGEITGNCSATGLYQKKDFSDPTSLPFCLPKDKGFSKNPINRRIEYKIYLPKNPKKIYEDAGLPSPPQVPIFYNVKNPNSMGGPEPVIVPNIAEGYLDVSVDLTNFTGDKYSRKIESGWVLPSPSNWSLKAWQVQIKILDVHNDGDGYLSGDGDWRFWANINNSKQEWTKMYDCDGCVHGRIDYGNDPWSTNTNSNRSLGPDALLFPGQKLFIHTSGYDDDVIVSDFTGQISELLDQKEAGYRTRSKCKDNGLSNCCSYTLTYSVKEGRAPLQPNLNREGRAIFNSYKLIREFVVDAIYPEYKARLWNHPRTNWAFSDTTILDLENENYYSDEEEPERGIASMSNEEFAKELNELRKNQPEVYNRFITELKEEFDEFLKNKKNIKEVYANIEAVKIAMPPAIWNEHFDYIKFPKEG